MQKLLIIGASILQLPAIVTAKKMGFYVGVIDYNPQGVGVPYADVFFEISTIDTNAILQTAKEFKPIGIMTMATDMPMRAIANATTKLGLPGISMETAIKATDKGQMIKAFNANAIEAPWFFLIDQSKDLTAVKEKLDFPCIVKPTDNAGSRGVILVKNLATLDSAYEYSKHHSRCGSIIVEEYMTGSEVSVEVMAVNGTIHILAITDKLTTGAPYFVEMGHCQPSQLPDEDLKKISDLAQRATKALGIKNGPAHVEIMLTKNGPKMIELGARMGGDCITSHLVPLSTGIDMTKATIAVATGQIPDLKPRINKGSAIRYFDIPDGTISALSGIKEAKQINGVSEIIFSKKIGDRISAIKSSIDRPGYVIAQAQSAKAAIDICDKARQCVHIKTKT